MMTIFEDLIGNLEVHCGFRQAALESGMLK